MRTNADITIYNAVYDPESRLNTYHRTVIRGAWFYVDNKVNVTSDGLASADVYKVRIPESAQMCGVEYVPANSYSGEPGTWTLQHDDYVVRGVCDLEINVPADLKKHKLQAFKITSWADNRFGGLPHWRIGGA